ncbi:hypothetical protein EPUS_03561 [Endocarpon pusillum Z07020]|uniref:Putative phospholipase n=1 Tax=Endocarpon pusillum (strain Z07020 / HMAS-L-300199) TaxID=1263415 RepID=U1HLY0_ENDPU|nr:uncharacterized protein EPUS_03561 [Endocarpon pusillum Z07020]ERF70009.1 hypothetical protein EPUS_03561 [Endocarpon pusillum Z07020]
MFSSLNPVPSFPRYRGPLSVGTSEYEILISDISSTSKVPDPTISTIKFRTFYPTQSTEDEDFSARWLPEPQKEWVQAYCDFLNAPPKIASFFSHIPIPLRYTTIPANRDASFLSKGPSARWPVLIFSHGLGGSCNAYSHLLGSLASCGVVCIAPEHRDQSAPVSLIRQVDGSTKVVRYKKMSHDPSPEVLSQRNEQLRVRLWELELLYTALSSLNNGENLKNLADTSAPSMSGKLDLGPSKVAWAGHSFGAATVVQFVKSVFWHQTVPETASERRSRSMFQSLYTPAENSPLKEQITPQSPVVLLDLWTMPLRGDETLWLWEKPLPCYTGDEQPKNNVLAIMSEQFYNWTSLLERMKAVLSKNPAEQERSRGSSGTKSHGPRLFYSPNTAHLSQSDFGVLFPWATKKWLRAEEPERTLLLNTRAILQLLRENQISVEGIKMEENAEGDELTLNDELILAEHGNIQGWVPVPIG